MRSPFNVRRDRSGSSNYLQIPPVLPVPAESTWSRSLEARRGYLVVRSPHGAPRDMSGAKIDAQDFVDWGYPDTRGGLPWKCLGMFLLTVAVAGAAVIGTRGPKPIQEAGKEAERYGRHLEKRIQDGGLQLVQQLGWTFVPAPEPRQGDAAEAMEGMFHAVNNTAAGGAVASEGVSGGSPWWSKYGDATLPASDARQDAAPGAEDGAAPQQRLYCFAVTRSSGPEIELTKYQFLHRTGIFGCDSWVAFSDEEVPVSPSPPWVSTEVLGTSLEAPAGKVEHIANAPIFVQAFIKVQEDPRSLSCDWVVKVDPDTVFIASRLRPLLPSVATSAVAGQVAEVPEGGLKTYLLSCDGSFGLFGSIEVLTRAATQAYTAGVDRCSGELNATKYGEDMFLKKCLGTLGIGGRYLDGLVGDGYCNASYFHQPCSSQAAYHPFKDVASYSQCLHEMKAAGSNAPAAAGSKKLLFLSPMGRL